MSTRPHVKLQCFRVIIDCKLISVSNVRNLLLKETDSLTEVQFSNSASETKVGRERRGDGVWWEKRKSESGVDHEREGGK